MSPDHDDEIERAAPENDRPDYLGAPPSPGGFTRGTVRGALVGIALIAVGFLAWPQLAEWFGSRPPTSPSPSGTSIAVPVAPAASAPAAPLVKAAAASSAPVLAAPSIETAPPAVIDARPRKIAVRPAGQSPEPSKPPRTPKSESRSAAASAPVAGPYWVQVGAFRDRRTADALAEKLRADKFTVQETVVHGPNASPGSDRADARGPGSAAEPGERYEVFVSGLSSTDLGSRVAGRGLSVKSAPDGAVVRPGVPLPEAVALSQELASQGLSVQVRRVRSDAAGVRAAPAPGRSEVEGTLHRVRVGSFPDRAAAEEARRELAARGYAGFLTREGG